MISAGSWGAEEASSGVAVEELAQQIDAVDSKLRQAISDLVKRLDTEAHEAARIDARGLPLIALGIIAGVPDGLADDCDGVVGWVLVGVAALLTGVAVRQSGLIGRIVAALRRTVDRARKGQR